MEGNTAKTYLEWEHISQPFKENGRLYVVVEHPTKKTPKTVRFYGELPPLSPLYSLFGFESTEDHILTAKESQLTASELAHVQSSSHWRATTLFGNIWYAPQSTPTTLLRPEVLTLVNWQDWLAEGRRLSKPGSR